MNQKGFEEGKKQLKYHSKNPIYNYLVNGFNTSVKNCFTSIDKFGKPDKILEIGVGEGQITEICLSIFANAQYTAADIASGILEVAKKKLIEHKHKISFEIQDIKNMPYENNSFDLIICCEVLEHVPEPQKGLTEIFRVLKPNGFAVVSVPREPIWRVLNMVRGYYWSNLGNTPGHVNHWSVTSFQKFVQEQDFEIIELKKPLPWTMVLAKKNV